MPVHVVCPSCATQLNIRDEHAGRPVKCPKCGTVIPPPAPDAPPPLPVTPPADAGGSPSAPEARPTAKPAATRPPRDRDRDDDDRDDRPKRKPRRRDDEDDNDRRDRPAPKKSGAGMILGIVGFIFLLCCGGIGGIGYYLYQKGKEIVQVVESVNLRVSRQSYDRLTEGMTPAEIELVLGSGKIANAEQVEAAFPDANKARAGEWKALADQGRVVLWRNGNDHLLCGFHPSAANGRLQLKTFQPSSGFNSAEQRFATDEEASKPGWGKKKEPVPSIEIAAWNLASQYQNNPADADRNYKGRTLLVSGVVSDVGLQFDEVMVTLTNPPPAVPPGLKVRFAMKPENAKNAWRLTRGQNVKLRGVCSGVSALFVDLTAATIDSQETDPVLQVPALLLVNEFAKDGEAAAKKYDGKQVWVLSAVVVRVDGNTLILSSGLKNKIAIRATFPPEFRSQIAALAAKPGGRVGVKGEFSTFADDEISLNRCWIVP